MIIFRGLGYGLPLRQDLSPALGKSEWGGDEGSSSFPQCSPNADISLVKMLSKKFKVRMLRHREK